MKADSKGLTKNDNPNVIIIRDSQKYLKKRKRFFYKDLLKQKDVPETGRDFARAVLLEPAVVVDDISVEEKMTPSLSFNHR